MRKFLRMFLVCFMTMFCGTVMADEVTIKGEQLTDYANEGGTVVNGFTFIALTNSGQTKPTVHTTLLDARLYAKNTLTIKSSNGNITKLVFNISTQGLKRLAPITASVGTIATQAKGDNTVTWSGEATEVTLTVGDKANYGSDGESKAGQLDFDNVVITTTGGGSTITVPTPSISGTTPFTENTEVTISGTPEGGKTYYTTDGSDPTSSSTLYSAPFTLTETTTVKAISYDKDNNASSVASKIFEKETIEKAANIAAFNALAKGTKVELTLTNAQVLGATNATSNKNFVIKDATGSTVIFDRNATLSFTKGQILNGTITGERTDYNGFTELQNLTGNTITATDGTITPKTATPEEVIAAGYFADTYKMENVECKVDNGRYYITVGENKIQIHDNFKYNYDITADGKYNLVGVLGAYRDVPYQFWLTEAPEAAQAITYPEAANIAAVKTMEDGTTVKLTLTNAVVNYANGTKDVYIEDATGAIDLYNLGEDFAYKAGQVLNGTLIAKYTVFRGLPELTYVKDVTIADEISATSGEAPTPVEMTPAEAAKAENACKLITVKNITLVVDGSNYYTDADKTLQVFDKFKLNYTPNTESAMDYTGILIPYYENFEICPTVEPTASQGGGETPATSGVMIKFTEEDVCAKGAAKSEYANGDFKLTCVDTKAEKLEIDANNAYFGTAEDYQKFTHRLKTGGKSGSSNSLTLTIPSDGTLKVYVRTGKNGETDRNLVLTQDGTELYNKVVQEADAVQVDMGGEEPANVYPVISVAVKAGDVTIGYPVNSLNFYAFEFIAGSSGIQNVVKPVVENGIRYNLAGQRVDENYKGVVIMNGKKYVVK